MNLFDETAKTLLAVTITGLVSGVIWLFRWHNLTDLRVHDLNRDVKHLQRNNEQLSRTIAALDVQDEQNSHSFRQEFASIDRRLGRCETRIYVIEIRVNIPQTQA